ncbi:YeeE/YedE thiosulfate transporter family protein [Leptotrichia sp. OH3620_COT-345]|uniref:YeeE/YedE thiosulfate transporter family protein n=1 Tax=Leptotrichia sp. OH3620_COT-345 TaxID=2491048 RepID=UPI001F1BBD92|nr:YeeE/YedE thiosulfate transporter family protein [Leptotrichia sp. OH3620_COT-345]
MNKEAEKINVTRCSKKKPLKSQIPMALVLTILIIAFGFYLNNSKLVTYWIFGIAFGMILQRSRFCFTAAFRDPILTGSTSLTRAVLLAISIGTIGFTAISFGSVLSGGKPVGLDSVEPLSVLIIIGGIIFGIGMVIAGGCASGTLMRFGEGFEMQWISFIFFILGSVIGAWVMGFLEPVFRKKEFAIYLPDYLGWIGALVFQFSIILIIYIIAVKWQTKKIGSGE